MIVDPESLAAELRYLPRVKDVDIVEFPHGKELWVVLKDPVNIEKLRKASSALSCAVAKAGCFSSMLPPSLAEMIWDGVMYIIRKETLGYEKPRTGAGNAPVAKVMKDLATKDIIYNVKDDEGLKVLQEYLKS